MAGQRVIAGNRVRLREKKPSDARSDYRWQTDPELVQLDAVPPLTMSFSQYLLDYTAALRQSSSTRRTFAIETMDGELIGNCVYYNIDRARGETELGIMIGDRDYWDTGYGADAVTALISHIFEETGLERIHLKTLDWNQRAQRCFLKCGFAPYGHVVRNGFDFVLMELRREQWEEKGSELRADG
jgi:RimJ/RimL family protein N-acetyltransferase